MKKSISSLLIAAIGLLYLLSSNVSLAVDHSKLKQPSTVQQPIGQLPTTARTLQKKPLSSRFNSDTAICIHNADGTDSPPGCSANADPDVCVCYSDKPCEPAGCSSSVPAQNQLKAMLDAGKIKIDQAEKFLKPRTLRELSNPRDIQKTTTLPRR